MSAHQVQVGVFRTLRGADTAVAELVEAGFPKESVTVICPTCSVDRFEGTHHQDPSGSHTIPMSLVAISMSPSAPVPVL